jgi:hypothetical protein
LDLGYVRVAGNIFRRDRYTVCKIWRLKWVTIKVLTNYRLLNEEEKATVKRASVVFT